MSTSPESASTAPRAETLGIVADVSREILARMCRPFRNSEPLCRCFNNDDFTQEPQTEL